VAEIKEIKRRINAIKNTQKITRAMKMIAAARLKRAQDRIIARRPYAKKLSELISHLVAYSSDYKNELMEPREIKNTLVVVISADRGLCGAFNVNVIKFASAYLSQTDKPVKLLMVGKKANDYFKKKEYEIIDSYDYFFSKLDVIKSNAIVKKIIDGYLQKNYDKVDLIYTEFKSVIKQIVKVETFLPVVKPEVANPYSTKYIYEPSAEDILDNMIPKHLNLQFWKVLLESNAAELGAKMTAMETATNNADEFIRTLTIMYNRARQESITKELLEIVSGAEALKNS
jgi:F-type H+-transporting ATPase subunit gamma